MSDDELRDARSAERFRERGHRLVDRLADHLASCHDDREGRVGRALDPEDAMRRFGEDFPERGAGDLDALVERILADGIRLQHPRFVGHQVSAPLPAAALVDLLAGLMNNGMAVFEMGPAATAMERSVLRWMATRAGWPRGEGHLTSGGSIGNLVALLTARQIGARLDARGRAAVERPALIVSEQAHYCAARAAHVMGWGADGLVEVPTDESFRLRPDRLEAARLEARRRGREAIAVFASACSTATGSYDPLEPIADFCEREGLWLHVDGAHGASALLSPRLRDRLAGIERADSLVWDAHKMLMMPALVTGVLFRDPAHATAAFAQRASYLFEADAEAEWFNHGHRTLECTKTMMGTRLWVALHLHGEALFREHVESRHDLATRFADALEEASDFELALRPQSNIVCFRHRPPGGGDLDERQRRVRAALLAGERFYLTQTVLRGERWLRTTLIHPETDEADLAALLDAIRAVPGR
ncbi:MAG: pyridoxal-dependent decarboxylase [Planctomycetota bacterium]